MDFLNKILDFLFGKEETTHKVSSTGVIFDDETFGSGVQFGEMVKNVNPVTWNELDIKNLPKYTVYDQQGQLSCVAHARALMCSIMFFISTGKWIDFSRVFIYRQRYNYPEGGMVAGDSFNICEKGLLPDSLLPSNLKTEKEANAVEIEEYMNQIADGIQADKRIEVPTGNIDLVASIMQTTGKPIMMFFKFNFDEWTDVPFISGNKTKEAHAVTFIPSKDNKYPSYGLYKGQKAFVIQDSWGHKNAIKGCRIITESFYKARNFYTDYFMKFKFEKETGLKPIYVESVVSLQDCLKYEGVFPKNVTSTGFMGNITIQAIKDFQKKHGLEQTGSVGQKTKALLYKLFS